ncbi:MAG: hypothetical protein IJH67_06085 [Thermoguttaceae bacterium]|nr:hypothetical protein [Thermoguttaceae bacterium]
MVLTPHKRFGKTDKLSFIFSKPARAASGTAPAPVPEKVDGAAGGRVKIQK